MSERWIVRAVLLVAFMVSVMHYTDNYMRFGEYPNDLPDLVTRPSIPAAWVLFTGFGIAAYVFYERGQRQRSAVCTAVYAVSGLIGPLHYTSGSLSEFDTFQHVNIVTDTLAGIAVLLLAVHLYRRPAPATA